MKLVIVESPAKCQTIQKYLGRGYKVLSSMGHIRTLKQDLDAVGIETNWTPLYENMSTKATTIKNLKAAAKEATEVIIATDDDREGEGIAYHICSVLRLDPQTNPRIVFHSITKEALQTAINNPKTLDMNKFYSQQTRAMLDMMIGYTISPVLWKQLSSRGLSAGRCQTPALKLVLDRDVEIETHNASQFWSLTGQFSAPAATAEPTTVTATLNNPVISESEAKTYLQQLSSSQQSRLIDTVISQKKIGAPKPLITSTLQQEASKSFHLSPKATMAAAQKLYEAGHITYMRTDNPVLSAEGALACRAEIKARFGETYLKQEALAVTTAVETTNTTKIKTTKIKATKTNKKRQEQQQAHEAIRPTHPEVETPEALDPIEAKIYRLIWQRALQSQMADAIDDHLTLTFVIECDPNQKHWTSELVKSYFKGWKALLPKNQDLAEATHSNSWSVWTKGLAVKWLTVIAEEGFTKPQARYTEASLIHALETKGIGRPSTFASLVTTIVDRNYVEKSDSAGTQITIRKYILNPNKQIQEKTATQTVGKESNKLQATPLGRTVAEFIYNHYSDLFAYTYTAQMEQELDQIAKGTREWKSLLETNWNLYKDRYKMHTAKSNKDGDSNQTNGSNESNTKKRPLGENISVILSRKGPLLVNESTKEFAPLPQGASFESITLAQALDAYKLKNGLQIGTHDGTPLLKKKGPYGYYVKYNELNIPCKPNDTVESIIEKIKLKQEQQQQEDGNQKPLYSRVLGDFTIKSGPYGLYFFKHTLKKAIFVSLPKASDPEKLTAEDMPTLYKMAKVKPKS
jgi:DNA topoisomerase-1